MSKEIADEYASSLSDLKVNSKPLINMLTILAEENIDHAGVIVDTVEKHLEKVHADIKLPVLYLVDSIIKNVGGAYTQKFSQSIVNMFTRTFKQVDEKVRSQMFKLRETWHDVFPASKLYQLDVKVNLIDPAWPIQAQPQQSNIHVNPNFLKKPAATTSTVPQKPEDEEKMRSIVAKKEQELLMLKRKKIEVELEQTRRQLELAAKASAKAPTLPAAMPTMPVALVNPVVPSALPVVTDVPNNIPIKQRLGPPVNKVAAGGRIAPVSGALVSARRDPRLARHAAAAPHAPLAPLAPHAPHAPLGPHAPLAPAAQAVPIAPNVFDIKPLDRVTKRKNVITIDVQPDAAAPPPRRDPRLEKGAREGRKEKERRRDEARKERERCDVENYIDKLQIVDAKRIGDLPPIPKIDRTGSKDAPSPVKRKKEAPKLDKRKKRGGLAGKDSAGSSSPEKKPRTRELNRKLKKERAESEAAAAVPFKELRNYHKERYMRRNKEKSESPDAATPSRPADEKQSSEVESSSAPGVVENKDVDLRVLHPVVTEVKAAPVAQKRSSTEMLEGKAKKNKLDKFDILFGNEDVDLRQLPQVEEANGPGANPEAEPELSSPRGSPRKDWHELKERADKKTPSKLDLVRAKLAEATRGNDKDRLGRPFFFSKSPSLERERRRTISTEDVDLRGEHPEEFDAEDHKKTISIIMNQAKEQYSDGQLDRTQYNTLMYQVLQLNEKLKLKEAKQRESLENSKRKLHKHIDDAHRGPGAESPPPGNNFGDIDERVTPYGETDAARPRDSDMRPDAAPRRPLLPHPLPALPALPAPPAFAGPQPPAAWRAQFRPRADEFARRPRGPPPPYFRGKFDKRAPRPPFDPRPTPLPPPRPGMRQGDCPLAPYVRSATPPPLGAPGAPLPPTDPRALEYVAQDPVKTIQIDGVPREIRFYGETAVVMTDWDDPREIRFLPGSRRVTFDNKDSVVLDFNDAYKRVEIDEQVFDIRFGAPTRELFIDGRWHECFFGGAPLGVLVDGKPRLVQLEGPPPQVDVGKAKRTDLVAGKINLIVDATHMCPVFLDAKLQKFEIDGRPFTIRFADALRTVLINERPFQVEFGGLPRPIFIGNEKHFIRFSVLPRHVKPGSIRIANMEGSPAVTLVRPAPLEAAAGAPAAVHDNEAPSRPIKTPSPEIENNQGNLDMLASLVPSCAAPAAASDYSSADAASSADSANTANSASSAGAALFARPGCIPGLDPPPASAALAAEPPPALAAVPAVPAIPALGNIDDLFAKLVASGIIKATPVDANGPEPREEPKVEDKKPKEDRSVIHKVDFFKPETFRVKQPALVARLYGGMQCSGCGARFPPEHTVRYSQHLDWHFRQNRRERDSARRAHSRHWHYDLADWVRYEEVEDLEEREKSWFETGGAEAAGGGEAASGAGGAGGAGAVGGAGGAGGGGADAGGETPSVAAGPGAPAAQACALCGDRFHQFYNEDHEEWHLRNSVHHDGHNYHPACFEDYKASSTKEESASEAPAEEERPAAEEEAIEIADADDAADRSDDESVVEVVEPDEDFELNEVDEGDEGDEDDVVFKAEPVVQVVVDDDHDTDDETAAERRGRDERAAIDFARVKIKQEPVDPDDEPIITAEEEAMQAPAETSQPTVLSSIDGNVQLQAAPAAPAPLAGIRINITKPLPAPPAAAPPSSLSALSAPGSPGSPAAPLGDALSEEQPLPPGEEPELQYELKPALAGVSLGRQPPVRKGNELSGLCSVM